MYNIFHFDHTDTALKDLEFFKELLGEKQSNSTELRFYLTRSLYRDLGFCDQDLGNRGSPPSHMNTLKFL